MKLKEGTPHMDAWKDSIGGDIAEVLFDEESIQRKVAEIGAEIRRDYAGRRVLLAGVLNGCFPFIALVRWKVCLRWSIISPGSPVERTSTTTFPSMTTSWRCRPADQ